jgi:hypothetical protein
VLCQRERRHCTIRLEAERRTRSDSPAASRTRKGVFFAEPGHSVSRGEQHVTEAAVLTAEIEQNPDLSGYSMFASHLAWLKIRLSPN